MYFSISRKFAIQRTMKSFIEIKPNSDFSIHNLPYCVFSTPQNVNKQKFIQQTNLLFFIVFYFVVGCQKDWCWYWRFDSRSVQCHRFLCTGIRCKQSIVNSSLLELKANISFNFGIFSGTIERRSAQYLDVINSDRMENYSIDYSKFIA